MSRRGKKTSRNIYDISSIKHVTRKFHVVVAQKKAKKCTRKCAARAKLFFCYLLFFCLSRCLRHLALHDFIFYLSQLRALLLAPAKSIY